MITKTTFLIGLVILVLIYVFRHYIITPYIEIKEKTLNYIFLAILVIYLIYGALFTFEETKEQFENVNNYFEGQKPDDRPHRWWDIDTYW